MKSAYGSLEMNQRVFFSHMVPGASKGYNIFIDLDTNFATVFEIWFCGGEGSQGQVLDNREVQRRVYFGHLDVPGLAPPKKRHHRTNRFEKRGKMNGARSPTVHLKLMKIWFFPPICIAATGPAKASL